MFRLFKRRSRRKKRFELEAKFKDPNNPGLYGSVEYEAYTDGSWEFELELTHNYARLAEDGPIAIHVEGRVIGYAEAGKRRTYLKRTNKDGELGFNPEKGQLVELVQNAQTRLSGQFEYD